MTASGIVLPDDLVLVGYVSGAYGIHGWVRIKLYKGNVIVVARDSKTDSLFDMNIATFDEDGGAYNQADAGGFIKLNALRMRIAAIAREKRGQ